MNDTTHEPAQHTSWQLARLADCSEPDAHDGIGFDPEPSAIAIAAANGGSAGAAFLRRIEDAVYERIADNGGNVNLRDYWDDASEIADGAVPIYTHALWQTFVDLGAYNEDPSEYGAEPDDLNKLAGIALYAIAQRLAGALFEEYEPADDDDETDA